MATEPTFSNGAAYADFDNDGDLDLVVNNINNTALLYKNTSKTHNYLSIQLEGPSKNKFGIGAKVTAYTKNGQQTLQHMVSRGYLSAVSNRLHFGFAKDTVIDSLVVHWNDKIHTLKNIKSNQLLKVSYNNANPFIEQPKTTPSSNLLELDSIISFTHTDNICIDFDREPLIPYAHSNTGPDVAVADVNGDQLDDVFICGAKNQPSELFIQQESGQFISTQQTIFEEDRKSEDVKALFFDADNDGDYDLIVGSGGNEFKTGAPTQPRLYLNTKGNFSKANFTKINANVSAICAIDFDKDSDLDLIITSNRVTGEFGKTPQQYFFTNSGEGEFKNTTTSVIPELEQLGHITDCKVIDFDNNGFDDIIVVGHWMPPTLFLNDGNTFKKQYILSLNSCLGLWNTISVDDFDNDGDLDFVCGNWGLNTRLTATESQPLQLYNYDFDDNGTTEPLVTHFYKGVETPFASKDILVKQMPFLNKSFLSYSKFADASLATLFTKEKLAKADKKYCTTLASTFFKNQGDFSFEASTLPLLSQASSIFAIQKIDSNKDGFTDLFIAGNNFEISTQLGQLDALKGMVLLNNQKGTFVPQKEQTTILEAVRNVTEMNYRGDTLFLVATNNGPIRILKINEDE